MSAAMVRCRLRAALLLAGALVVGFTMPTNVARADTAKDDSTCAPTVYATSVSADALFAVDGPDGTVCSRIAVGDSRGIGIGLTQLTPAPNGRVVYALSSGLSANWHYPSALVSVNAATDRIIGTVSLPRGATSFVVAPNGRAAYVVDGKRVDAIDLASMKVTGTITAIAIGDTTKPATVAISPNSRTLYVANMDHNDLMEVDTATDTVAATIPAGANQTDVVVGSGGHTVYVMNRNTKRTVTAIDAATGAVKAKIAASGADRLTASPDGDLLYAYSQESPTINAIDTSTDRVTGTVSLTDWVNSVTFSPDGTTAYATDALASPNAVSVIDTATSTVTASITVPGGAQATVFTPDGTRAYIVGGSTASVINTQSNAVTGTIPLPGGAQMLTIANGGTDVFTGNDIDSDTVSAIDVASGTVVATVNSELASAGAVALTPDNQYAYVAGADGSTVRTIDLATGQGVGGPITVGADQTAIAFTPDGSQALVVNSESDTVSAISTAAHAVTATIPVGTYPQDIAISSSGQAYVANGISRSISVIDTATDAVTSTIPLGAVTGVAGIALSPTGATAYVTITGGVAVVDLTTAAVTSTIPVGSDNSGVAVSPDGSRLYVASASAGTLSVVDLAAASVTTTVTVGKYPEGVASDPQGSYVYTTANLANTVSVLDTSTDTVTQTVALGKGILGTPVGGIAVPNAG